MIKISVITITYNAAACLQRTLDSVLSQTYPNIEHLIVDGASTDNTVVMAEQYKAKSDKTNNGHDIRIQSEPDRGLYDAMNKGLERATGDYIIYMNAGDFFPSSDTISAVAKCAADNNLPAIIYGDTDIVDNDGNYIGKRHLLPPEHLTWKSFRHGMLVCHQAFYANTFIAKRHKYNLKYRHSADVDWCIRVMKDAGSLNKPMINIHKTVACYTREGNSTVNHRASLMERFSVMRSHYGLITTTAMHLWFIIRAVLRKITKK